MSDDHVYYRDSRRVPFANRISWRSRNRVCDLFFATMQPTATSRVLDVGVSEEDTSFEANMLERRYPWPEGLTCAGIHDGAAFRRTFPALRYVPITPRQPLPFADSAFDIVYSNAVVEHVGGPHHQGEFLRELTRVGRRVFVVAPNRWFPIEHHTGLPFVHWLPQTCFRQILRPTRWAHWSHLENLFLTSARSLVAQFPPGSTSPTVLHAGVGFGPWRSNVIVHT